MASALQSSDRTLEPEVAMRIHVGIGHAGRTLDVEPADRTIRVYDEDGVLVAEVPCTTTKSIARFKVRRPEPPRCRPPSGSTR